MPTESDFATVAELCHEINRAYCQLIGDNSQLPWPIAPEWQRDSAINGVRFAFNNPNVAPSEMHENWMREKLDAGWTYGETKDPEAKTHPCLVPYDELPDAQRVKDIMFQATVRATLINASIE